MSPRKKHSGLCATKYCRNSHSSKSPKCSKCMMREWRAHYPLRDAYTRLRQSAERRKKEFTITKEQFEKFCDKTGYLELRGNSGDSLTIDRRDNNHGYHIWNIRILTRSENTAKGNRERYVPYFQASVRGTTEEDPF